MKVVILFILLGITALSQEAIQGTILHDNLEREYILYVPLS